LDATTNTSPLYDHQFYNGCSGCLDILIGVFPLLSFSLSPFALLLPLIKIWIRGKNLLKNKVLEIDQYLNERVCLGDLIPMQLVSLKIEFA